MEEGAKKKKFKKKKWKTGYTSLDIYFFIVRNPCIHSVGYEYRYPFIWLDGLPKKSKSSMC